MNARQFAISLTSNADRMLVPLNEEPKIFGRIPAYVDICLRHETIAKMLFEIRWDAQRQRHEIQVLGAYYSPSLNGETLTSEECRLLSPGDIVAIGPFRMEYIEVLPDSSNQRERDGFIEISRALLNKAQTLLAGCEVCDVHAAVPFDSVLDRFTNRKPGTADYVLRIELTYLNCGSPMTEKSLVALASGRRTR